jgi:hypothetical protein
LWAQFFKIQFYMHFFSNTGYTYSVSIQ